MWLLDAPVSHGASHSTGGSGLVLVVLGVRVELVVLVLRLGGERRRVAAPLGGKLRLQAFEIGAARAVLQLAGDLRLLGLGPAAPHGSTPSMRRAARRSTRRLQNRYDAGQRRRVPG